VDAERTQDLFSPSLEIGVARDEHRAHEIAEGTTDRRERDVTFVRLELARSEEAPRALHGLLELAHDRRLADAGVPGDQDEGLSTVASHVSECFEQSGVFALTAMQAFADQ